LGACGAFAPWQGEHNTFAPPPEKSLPWQIWQEKKLLSPGAFFAESPCGWGAGGVATHLEIPPWWQPEGFPKQETPETPPVRSTPWQPAQENCEWPEM
jgi:hypothetical protein